MWKNLPNTSWNLSGFGGVLSFRVRYLRLEADVMDEVANCCDRSGCIWGSWISKTPAQGIVYQTTSGQKKKRRPEQSDQKNQTLPVTWESYCLLLILQCLLRSDAKFSCNFPGSPLMWRGATLTAYHCSKNCCRSWHQGWCACKKVCARELETIFPEKNPTSCFHLQVAVNSHQIFDPY